MFPILSSFNNIDLFFFLITEHCIVCWMSFYKKKNRVLNSNCQTLPSTCKSQTNSTQSLKTANLFPETKKSEFNPFPVRTRRRFNVYTTSVTSKRRRMNVKTTSHAYWVKSCASKFVLLLTLGYARLSNYHERYIARLAHKDLNCKSNTESLNTEICSTQLRFQIFFFYLDLLKRTLRTISFLNPNLKYGIIYCLYT